MNPTYFPILIAVGSFIVNLVVWLVVDARHRGRDEEKLALIDDLKLELVKVRADYVQLQSDHNNVVTYLKMKNGDLAREVL